MNKRPHSKLWAYFAVIVFMIMLVTAIIMATITFAFYHAGLLKHNASNPIAPIIFLLFISVIIGTVISLIVAQKILKPITAISEISSEVAAGNFNIRMEQVSRVKEIQDLTQNFNRMIQELSSIETLRNDFVVNVSHEFKTPIAAIEGYATLLQSKDLAEAEQKEYTQMIISASRQLSTLTNNILKLSKLENQEIVLEKAPYRLDEQIRQAILLLETQWNENELALHLELPNTIYCGNEKLLMQVWMNIIGNAIKFTPKGGKVAVELSSESNKIIVQVSDSGYGMDATVARHIFDKFYQADAARKSEGNGLGLALSKRIIDLCEGEITVQSELEKGSLFTISLPNITSNTNS